MISWGNVFRPSGAKGSQPGVSKATPRGRRGTIRRNPAGSSPRPLRGALITWAGVPGVGKKRSPLAKFLRFSGAGTTEVVPSLLTSETQILRLQLKNFGG